MKIMGATTFSIATLSIQTLSIIPFSIVCHYAEYSNYLNVMLSVVMLSVVMLTVVILNVVASNYDNLTTVNFSVKLKRHKNLSWGQCHKTFLSVIYKFS